MPRLLLLEPDAGLRAGLEAHLAGAGFDLEAFAGHREALARIGRDRPGLDLAVLALPDGSGLGAARGFRAQRPDLPLMLITDHATERDCLLGQDLGAFDCVAKTCSVRELCARIRALLRRTPAPAPAALTDGPVRADLDRQVAFLGGEPLDLTRREFDLLAFFLQHPGQVLSRERLYREVWGMNYLGESRTVDTHVRRVRAKLGPAADQIDTVVGAGYRYLGASLT